MTAPMDDAAGGAPPSFGAAIRTVAADAASEHGLPAAFGVEVGHVTIGSPADTAGVRVGDIITAVGAYTLNGGADQFRQAVAARRPGDTMRVTVWRDRHRQELSVHFPSTRTDASPAADPPTGAT
ncbi:MAG: PDZ domain-containing protein [Candidatus Dormibacteria bacterium]